jgi:hypothetical protein
MGLFIRRRLGLAPDCIAAAAPGEIPTTIKVPLSSDIPLPAIGSLSNAFFACSNFAALTSVAFLENIIGGIFFSGLLILVQVKETSFLSSFAARMIPGNPLQYKELSQFHFLSIDSLNPLL